MSRYQRSLGHLGNNFTKKNDVRLHRLENEVLSISQQNMKINQYFSKVNHLSDEISKLDLVNAKQREE